MRLATLEDIDGLHMLASAPLVYRYLFDGAPPDKELLAHRLADSIAMPAEAGFGTWILESVSQTYAGCVELRPYPSPRSAELTYLLHPNHWGRGLATRMAWTAVTRAFRAADIDRVIAGADLPNVASFALMRRLGMQFHKTVRYPLGGGEEYVLHHDDASPIPRPAPIPIA